MAWSAYSSSFSLNIGGALPGFNLDIGASGEPIYSALSTVIPGCTYNDDTQSIVIPIAALAQSAPYSVPALTESWPDFFQALLLALREYIDSLGVSSKPRTVSVFMLEDWNRNNAKFGRHMKRLFLVEFTVENSPTNVFNSGE